MIKVLCPDCMKETLKMIAFQDCDFECNECKNKFYSDEVCFIEKYEEVKHI